MGGRNFFVQSGRVAFINYGPLEGQSVVIVDIVDNSRVRSPLSFIPLLILTLR